ncbi:tetraacyldisaccharide 4'-kinase [Roseiarcus fermentans]|uniref:tetraacyldisaccharide 4'-kinase n=1 Tax=Roseiarcus fermentans TaxID=1473586 RepID=UPI0011BE49A7|nr:tetraacyldisaccharide 4'-kinase [Roseiarcus fermentans]
MENRDLARAQIATLLLELPDPPAAGSPDDDGLQKRRLARDLSLCGLLKADDGWDEQHPRTGTAPAAADGSIGFVSVVGVVPPLVWRRTSRVSGA